MILPLRVRVIATPFIATVLLGFSVRNTLGQGNCTLCYDGSEPLYLDASPSELQGLTCGDFQFIAKLEPPDTETCENYQILGLMCGCPTPPDSCTLCYDGSLPSPELLDFTVAVQDETLSCRSLNMAAGIVLRDDSPDACGVWHGFGTLCGCSLPPGGCPICADGSLPPDLDAVLDVLDEITSCAALAAYAANPLPEPGSPSCSQWQGFDIACQCPRPAEACNLCEDGSGLPPQGEDSAICELLNTVIAFVGNDECRRYQATAGIFCGCDNPVASLGYCRICGGDTLLPDFERSVGADEDGNEKTCVTIEFNEEGLECEAIQRDYGAICCETLTEPPVTSDGTSAPLIPVTEPPVVTENTSAPVPAPNPTSNTNGLGFPWTIFVGGLAAWIMWV